MKRARFTVQGRTRLGKVEGGQVVDPRAALLGMRVTAEGLGAIENRFVNQG